MNDNDLISRAAAIEALGERPHNWTDSDSEIAEVCAWESHKSAIENVPAVVNVVRCRDCKYGKLCFDADGHGLIQCTNTSYPTANVETWPLELDWYCAGGERRDDDADG